MPPNHFCLVPIVLVMSKSFCLCPKHFGQGQIRLFLANFYNFDLTKMIWTQPKQITLLTAEIIKWQKCAGMGLNGFHTR